MNKIIEYMKNNIIDYKNFVIIYDILTYNFNQIESDLIKGKISKNDVNNSYNLLKNINKESISDYIEYRLNYISN